MNFLNTLFVLLLAALIALVIFYWVPVKYLLTFVVVLILAIVIYIITYAALMLRKFTRNSRQKKIKGDA